jgi:zinc D-Ala-D-Ala dipeptidase
MNLRISIFLFLVLITDFSVSYGQSSYKKNPYNLQIISDINTYNTLKEANPEKALINLENYIPGIVLDIRYATRNNFTHRQIYTLPAAFVRKPAAEALLKVEQELNKMDLGLKIYDAYRPYSATVRFFKVCPDTSFCAPPWTGSKHNRGCAVDVSLIDIKTGKELAMPTGFDDFTGKAAHSYMQLPDTVIRNRQILKNVMTRNGFSYYNDEWWHYNFRGWEKYELMNLSFSELKKNSSNQK